VTRRTRAPAPPPPQPDWRDELAHGRGGALAPTFANAALALAHDEDWRDVLCYNAFTGEVFKRRPPPCHALDAPDGGTALGPWTDGDTLRTTLWLERAPEYAIRIKPEVVHNAVEVAARHRTWHPVRDYLAHLRHDGVPRVDTWLVDFCGAPATPYTRAIGRWFFIGAVARASRPGCKLDTVLTLEGPQGVGKSSVAAVLGGEFYADTPIEPGEKDGYQALRGRWIIELPELDRYSRTEASRIKAFVSSAVDTYRPSYGRRVESFPRQCIFLASVNKLAGYLPDGTGNRRWLATRAGAIDVPGLAAARDQLWAEARNLYIAGAPWWATTDEERAWCRREQEARRQVDPWEPAVEAFVAGRDEVTVEQILGEKIGRPLEHRGRNDEMRVAEILQGLEWERVQRRRNGRRVWLYVPAALAGRGEDPAEVSPTVTNPSPTHQTPVGDAESSWDQGVGTRHQPSPTSCASTRAHARARAQPVGDVGDGGDRQGTATPIAVTNPAARLVTVGDGVERTPEGVRSAVPGVHGTGIIERPSPRPLAAPRTAVASRTAVEAARAPRTCPRGHWPPRGECGPCGAWFDDDGSVREVPHGAE